MGRKIILQILFFYLILTVKNLEITSPDERLSVDINVEKGIATYSINMIILRCLNHLD